MRKVDKSKNSIKKYNNWRFLVTSSCNSNCFFCHRDGAGTSNIFLDFQFFKNIIQKYKNQINKIRFAGGEPLLHPDIFKMIKIVSSLTKDVGIVTNGILLQEHIKEIKDSKLPKITVSLHSLTPDVFKQITGIKNKQYHEIIGSLKELNKFLKIKLNVVILRGFNTTQEEIKKLIDFVVENGFNIEFIELDLGSIKNISHKKYHYAPELLIGNIKRIKSINFEFDDAKGRWISIFKDSKIEVQKALCYNSLCEKCITTRPILVYPNKKINRCRLGNSRIKGVDINF